MPIALKPPVKPSTLIAAYGYDLVSRTLAVRFNGGAVYHYADVAPEQVEALEKAQSAGAFFGEHIRGKHPHERVDPDPPTHPATITEHEGATPD